MHNTNLRKTIRQRRLKLTKKEQTRAAQGICRAARDCSTLLRARRVLSYRAFAGELSPELLTSSLAHAEIFLPRICNYRRRLMHFYSQHTAFEKNRFGILEPCAHGSPKAANRFDVILVPLVAFDRNGNRLGMGAGYYDRALASLGHQLNGRPLLVGVAHAFQEIDAIDRQPWDVPLHAVLTDKEFIPISRPHSLHSDAET